MSVIHQENINIKNLYMFLFKPIEKFKEFLEEEYEQTKTL
jgi:hypothetical protein